MITREQAVQWLRNHPEETGDGAYMAQTIVDLHDDLAAAQDRADVMTEALRLAAESEERSEADAERLRAEVATLTDLLRLAEASVSLLRADLATRDAMLESERDLSGKLETELRRLRAAEAPGTDDEAVAPWESVGDEDRPIWRYWWTPRLAVLVSRRPHGWAWFDGASWSDRGYIFAVDAMLAAERATASP